MKRTTYNMFARVDQRICVLLMLSTGAAFFVMAVDSVETVIPGGENAVLTQVLTLCTWCVSCAIVFGAALVALVLSNPKENTATTTTDD